MNKYVVAFIASHDGELKQEIIEAVSKLEAGFSYLGYTEDDAEGITSLDDLYEHVWNQNGNMHILKITGNKRSHSDDELRVGLND